MDSNQTGQKISAEKLMGGASPSLGKLGQGSQRGKPTVGNLARIVRSNRVKITENEKNITINVEKISNNYDSIEEVTESLNNLHEQMVEQMLNKMDEEKKEEEKGDKVTGESVEGISKSLDVIAVELASLGTLMADNLKQRKQQADQDRIEDQKKKQAKEEAKAEKGKKKQRGQRLENLGGFVKKITFFDQIKKFFGSILAGSAILGFFKWIKDPENQKKYNDFIDFFADKVPLIIAGIAGFLAINLAPTLIGVLGTITGVVTGLAALLGPAGLLGIIAALSIVAGAFLLDKFVKPQLQKLWGGTGFTASGLAFGLEDVMDLKDEYNKFMNDRGASFEEKKGRLKMFDDLAASMRENKRINDDIVGKKFQIETLEKAVEREAAAGNEKSRKMNQQMLDTRRKELAQLENDKRYSNKMVTSNWMKLQIPDSTLEDTIRGNNREVMRVPGAVDASLRRESGPRSSQAGTSSNIAGMTQTAFAPITQSAALVGLNMKEKMFDPGKVGSEYSLPDIDYTDGMGMNLDSFMTSNLKVKSPNFSAKAMEFGKDPINFEIGTPVVQTPKIVPLPMNGQGSGPKSGSTSNQSPVPTFSAVDPNNPLITTINSIYNSVN